MKLYGKLFKAVESLEFFTSYEWEFESKGLPEMWESLGPADRDTFDFDIRRLHWPGYLEAYHTGCKLFMLSQTEQHAPQAKRHFNRSPPSSLVRSLEGGGTRRG